MEGTVKRSITLSRAHDTAVRRLVGPREYSSFVDEAVGQRLQRMRLAEWLRDAEARSGPIPQEIQEEVEAAWRQTIS